VDSEVIFWSTFDRQCGSANPKLGIYWSNAGLDKTRASQPVY